MSTALRLASLVVVLSLNLQAAQLGNGGRQPMLHVVQGRVVGVLPQNAGGILQIRSTGAFNRAVNLRGSASGVRSFSIGPGTQFQMSNGMNWMPASAAILRPGQRVLVQAQGQQAIAVRFVVGNRNGRRGGYYAPRGRSVMPANRTAQAARASSVAQQIAKANRSAPRHSVAAQRPAHTVPKKR